MLNTFYINDKIVYLTINDTTLFKYAIDINQYNY